MPFTQQEDIFFAEANVNYKKHSAYLDNGVYILQINFGLFGIIQKELKIIDIFNNEKGANYGLPIAFELKSDKDYILLNIDSIDKIERMEIVIFDKIENEYKKIGTKEFLNIKKEIFKEELIFRNDKGEIINLKYNHKYYYKVILYTTSINDIKYISISKFMPITFFGFNFGR